MRLAGRLQRVKHIIQLGIVPCCPDIPCRYRLCGWKLSFPRLAVHVVQSNCIPWIVPMLVCRRCQDGERSWHCGVIGKQKVHQVGELGVKKPPDTECCLLPAGVEVNIVALCSVSCF
jgi:hypothetical protein